MQSLRRLRAPAASLPRRFACEARPAGASAKAPPTAEVLALSAELQAECAQVAARGGRLAWVFLGAPGVGKGTYASRVAALMGVPHVSAGDLVRAEIKAATPLAKQMAEITAKGQLLPDELVLRLLQRRLQDGAAAGERGVLLDGFPRTRAQAGMLDAQERVQVALNLDLREEVLIEKCCGRRVCGECGKGYNVADIHEPATATQPAIVMPPLDPPPACAAKMQTRSDDTPAVVRARLAVYRAECGPVEQFYAADGRLAHFEVTGGIPETMPRLLRDVLALVRAHAPPAKK